MQPEGNTGFLTAVAMTAATLMLAHHIAGKAARDALFLTYFDVSDLPKAMMVSAAVSVAAVVAMSRLLARHGPARLVPPLYLVSALLLAAQWYLSDPFPQIAAAALYLHVSVLNSILISGFWSVVNERFDPYAAKKVIVRLTAATTFGGLLGGVAAQAVASASDTHAILLMLSAMHLICAAAVAYLGRGPHYAPSRDETGEGLLSPMRRSPLLRRMALLALLVATTAAVLDYILKAEASASLSSEELIGFFSYFYMAVGLGTFLLQSAVGNRALRWLGLGGCMAAWPVAILLTGGSALFLRSLVTVTLMRACANLLYNSFFRSGFELLYTPIAPADKRTGKVLIDVGADRSGDLLGGLIVMILLLMPSAQETILLVAAMVLAGLCLMLVLVLHQGYVKQLARNLRSGQLTADDLEVFDATTARTLAATQTTIDRDQLLREIAALRGGNDVEPKSQVPVNPGALDPVTEAILELRSGDESRIRRVLASQPMTPELLPHVIPLLQNEAVLREALRGLRQAASSNPGQLVDALLDPMQHPLVRRRLPLVLAYSDNVLTVHGLSAGLGDPDWNVRFRSAQGLEALRKRQPQLQVEQERLLTIIEREARILSSGQNRERASGPVPTLDDDRTTFVFLLLGTLYDADTIDLCLRALRSDDRTLKGTALEYLENLLPGHIWTLIQPALAPGGIDSRRKRTAQQAARELKASSASLREMRSPAGGDENTVDRIE